MTGRPAATALIVDDDARVRALLERALRQAGYETTAVGDATAARAKLGEAPWGYTVALCDLALPGEPGADLVAHIVAEHPETAVLVVSGDHAPDTADHLSGLGALGYLVKPFSVEQLATTIADALRRHQIRREHVGQAERLERIVFERTRELEYARQQTVRTLALAAEFRDPHTQQHAERVARHSAEIAARLGWSAHRRRLLETAALLHDVGKICISDHTLRKNGPLSPAERRAVEAHAEIGYRLLQGSGDEVLELAATIAWTHHERLDGSGYPRRLRGDGIPEEGRIVAVADVFDALVSDRPYRPAYPEAEAVELLLGLAGKQLEPAMVDALVASLERAPGIPAMFVPLRRGGRLDLAFGV